MRIAVAGTHATGKSTLIDDFLAAHPDYAHEPEPYEWLESLGEPMSDSPGAADFHRQLEISVEHLRGFRSGVRVIIERSPLDFVAYLRALDDRLAADLLASAMELAALGMEHVDLLVILPLDPSIAVPASEDPELREAMNEQLLELVAAGDLIDATRTRVIEIEGDRRRRLALLERALSPPRAPT